MIRLTVCTAMVLWALCLPAFAAITDNSDGTASDDVSGLMWQMDGVSGGTKVWASALNYCEGLDLAGHSDWRLPDRNELRSIVNYGAKDPATYGVLTSASSAFWSSTSSKENTDQAWYVHFETGRADANSKAGTYLVRCVRSGPGGSPDPVASLSGAPSGTVAVSSVSVTVGGANVDKYRWRLDSGTYSSEVDSAVDISLSGLSDGEHTLYVLGVNQAGKLQQTDTTATWTVATGAPVVTTAPAEDITQTSAVLGGEVTSDEGSSVTERGVCLSTSANPTTGDTKKTMGTGTGTFSDTVDALTDGTTYYVRAYAINSKGTGYGSEVSFTAGSNTVVPALGEWGMILLLLSIGVVVLWKKDRIR